MSHIGQLPAASDQQACARYRRSLLASMHREVLSSVRGVRSSRADALVPDSFAILVLDLSDPTAGAIATSVYERAGRPLPPKCRCGCDGFSVVALPRESAMAIASVIDAADLLTEPLAHRDAVRVLTIAAHGVLSSQIKVGPDNAFSHIVAGGSA